MHPPNVILVMADQLRSFEVGCYGNTHIRTPHLDQLAAAGMRFDLAVTNNPVCTPARSCLLTGQYSRTCTGELGNVSDDPPCPRRRRLVDPTIADCFRNAGYDTAIIGKWHIDPSPLRTGFDYALYPLTVHRYAQQTYIENDRDWFTVGPYAPDFEVERACAYIAQPRKRPFFLYYNIPVPHNPIGPAEMPESYATLFSPQQVPLRPNVWQNGTIAHDETRFKVAVSWDYFWRMWGPCWNAAPRCGYPGRVGELPADALPAGFSLRHLVALYYGAVAWVDDLMGRLMAAIDSHGLAENTLLVFLSDHGDNLGSHHLFNKDCLFEESIRIPLMLRWMHQVAPAVNHRHIAQIIDVAPTVLALCGIPVPATMQGRDLSSLVRGGSEVLTDNWAFIETDPSQFGQSTIGIRTPDFLYGMTLHPQGREIDNPAAWFYDLRADPFQQQNLITTARHATIREQLRQRLAAWHAQTPWLHVAPDEGNVSA